MRQIEWIGHDSIFAGSDYRTRLTAGTLSQRQLEGWRLSASERVYRIDGRTARVMRKQDVHGFTRSYKWGPQPGSYIMAMEDGDWRLLRESYSGVEFRDVTDGVLEREEEEAAIRTVKVEGYRSLREFLREMNGKAEGF